MHSQSTQTNTFTCQDPHLLFLMQLFDCSTTQGGATVSPYSVATQRVNNTGYHTNGVKAVCSRPDLP